MSRLFLLFDTLFFLLSELNLLLISYNPHAVLFYVKKVKESIAVNGTPSHSYGVSLAVWDHLPPDTSEHTPPSPQPDRLVLDLPTT